MGFIEDYYNKVHKEPREHLVALIKKGYEKLAGKKKPKFTVIARRPGDFSEHAGVKKSERLTELKEVSLRCREELAKFVTQLKAKKTEFNEQVYNNIFRLIVKPFNERNLGDVEKIDPQDFIDLYKVARRTRMHSSAVYNELNINLKMLNLGSFEDSDTTSP